MRDPIIRGSRKLKAGEKLVPSLPGQFAEDYAAQYTELKRLHKRGNGRLCLVESKSDHRVYLAKKTVEAEHKFAVLEMQRLPRLKHPNVLSIRESFLDADENFIMVKEFCAYGSLAHQISTKMAQRKERFARLPEPVIRKLLVDVAQALAHTHEQRLVHLDLKPENVLIARGGTSNSPTLA